MIAAKTKPHAKIPALGMSTVRKKTTFKLVCNITIWTFVSLVNLETICAADKYLNSENSNLFGKPQKQSARNLFWRRGNHRKTKKKDNDNVDDDCVVVIPQWSKRYEKCRAQGHFSKNNWLNFCWPSYRCIAFFRHLLIHEKIAQILCHHENTLQIWKGMRWFSI